MFYKLGQQFVEIGRDEDIKQAVQIFEANLDKVFTEENMLMAGGMVDLLFKLQTKNKAWQKAIETKKKHMQWFRDQKKFNH